MIEYQVHLDIAQATLRTLHRDAEVQHALARAVQPRRSTFRVGVFSRWLQMLRRSTASHS
ncbi:hypothetical protein [Deinococcus sonorensis]|uniref:Uncharacterized protein n=2 Tax=Deinococcus sonorensis TaxID=309891 RepID=A0AAU7U6H5_9DEIO